MATYTLPDLPYDFSALEPHISGAINELHHDKHHAAYVAGANQALEQLAEAREKEAFGSILLLEKNLAFHLGGHVNHTIFWNNLSPNGGGEPTGALAEAIGENFGSFEAFVKHFSAAALGLQGSGWGVLGYDTIASKLLVFQLYDQQANVPLGVVPLLLVDLWEHAFYLQYKNVKADYVKAIWNVINWADVSARYERATASSGLILG